MDKFSAIKMFDRSTQKRTTILPSHIVLLAAKFIKYSDASYDSKTWF